MQDFALHLVGTVPNLPLPLSTTDPASVASALGIGHEAQVQTDLARAGTAGGQGALTFPSSSARPAQTAPQAT